MMKLSISLAAAFLALAFVPLASAVAPPDFSQGPCIIYPQTREIGGFWIQMEDHTVPGQSVTVFFVTVTTQAVTVYGAGVFVPGTWVTTPGVCYGGASDFLGQFVLA